MRDREGEGGRTDDGQSPPSQRVKLEVAILASDLAAAGPDGEERPDTTQRNVLVVAAGSGLADYIATCLHERDDLHVTTVDAVSRALLARPQTPDLVIADAPRADIIHQLSDIAAILIVDEAVEPADRRETPSRAPLSVIVRPFNARSLLAEVSRLIGDPPADTEIITPNRVG